MSKVLVTGGAGYIGSHTVLLLLEAGREVVVLDNLTNSSEESLRRVQRLTGRELTFIKGDIRDADCLDRLFADHDIDSVIHFAGLKAVGESVEQPLQYYDCNVVGTVRLLEAMERAGVRTLVFSSSATVYGDPASVPIKENFPLSATNPYGASKLHIEDMLRDLYSSDNRWQVALLRYFNPVGAHESGEIGEDPNGIPNNLMPFIAQVAIGKRAQLSVFGGDYATPDGTGVRDYIHVMDLAQGHLAALQALEGDRGLLTVNLGTGRGYSVLEMIAAFSKASGRDVPYQIVERRSGDVATCYADPAHAEEVIGWKAARGIDDMCCDHWRWQESNPEGYGER
ncbi:MAG: UDP-galactose-4-epimerase [Alcanivorax borkumensis]|jgi:UDP-glucose 4-epimerase|uniref:UDP-glucose 4-epimerase GalE n=1 Tax=Alcanivorax TaxID=59753 RepID=UPI0002FE4359|nr:MULTISPECIES: UDP-glucose 4-epimerase GalE [Alcanivorax]EUC71620.1 UDP-glucose 4-epimerase [Alcanivorax sp. 97CO-5]OJH06687.1 MAG: UDP-galactose-4-epimerase [Alcanivorax borkumensis]PKG03039.1 UDP-glucose 4-epimerase GalE [Alcanivorax sp. 97CO-6]BAP13851.1 UDP-glucose 4-epimerase [Alcanivorax sp. NBRC 101098]